jgi:hypothetical protein
MKASLATLLALSLAACADAPRLPADSPRHAYATGTRLTLNRPLEIPADAATARLQFGQPVARNGVREEEPHCIFEVNSVRDQAQRIEPDRMRVTGIQRRIQTFAGMPVLPYYADFSTTRWHRHGRRVGFGDDDGPSHLYYVTEFRLAAEKQPDIRALTCQHNQMMPGVAIMRHLTLAEIRAALGDWFTLELVP